MDNDRGESPLAERKELSGEYLFRVLKPAGCIFVLLLAVLALVICFTHKSDPVLDYVPPHDAEFYRADPEALVTELKGALLPYFPGAGCAVEGGKVLVTAPADKLGLLRDVLADDFGPDLFIFRQSE